MAGHERRAGADGRPRTGANARLDGHVRGGRGAGQTTGGERRPAPCPPRVRRGGAAAAATAGQTTGGERRPAPGPPQVRRGGAAASGARAAPPWPAGAGAARIRPALAGGGHSPWLEGARHGRKGAEREGGGGGPFARGLGWARRTRQCIKTARTEDQRDLTFSERTKNPNRKNKIERSKKKFDDVDSLLFRVGLALSYVEKCCSNDDEQNIH